jgi:hypothetical protein
MPSEAVKEIGMVRCIAAKSRKSNRPAPLICKLSDGADYNSNSAKLEEMFLNDFRCILLDLLMESVRNRVSLASGSKSLTRILPRLSLS